MKNAFSSDLKSAKKYEWDVHYLQLTPSAIYQSVKEYLFSFTIPREVKVSIKRHDPQSVLIAKDIINSVKKVFPDLNIQFVGSSSLRLPGLGDIDLLAASYYRNFSTYLPGLSEIFGNPIKVRRKFVEWKCLKSGHEVELTLVDPRTYFYKKLIKTFDILENDRDLLREYREMKISSNGLSLRSYHKKKMFFFQRILK